jgi:hypothetical protein
MAEVPQSAEVARLLLDAIITYESFACREWLEWGGSILFGRLMAEAEVQERELEESRKREEVEKERQAVVEARAEGFREGWRVLTEACHLVLAEFRVKTLSKEGLQTKNIEFEAEVEAIEWEEKAWMDGESEGKQKAGEGEGIEEPTAKRVRVDDGEA